MELDSALDFARSRHNGVLVTQKRDGRPQLSNVSYAVIDDVIKVSITANRVKYINLSRDPRASMYVTKEDFWGYVVFEGEATLSDISTKPDDPGVEELIEVYRAVLGEHPDWDDYRRAMVADKRVVVRLRPTYAYGALGG
jgi:PPOX class probable F420-dependent enzyme